MSSYDISAAIRAAGKTISHAIAPSAPTGRCDSLTEAVEGNAAGLAAIAEAINNLADAVRENP